MTQEDFFKRYKYSIRTDKVGGGAFGTVYKAFDEILNREVAIKVSEVKIMGGKEFSLKDEFDAIKDVPVHPNIANYEELITLEMPNGIFDYAVMQFYKDGNLSSFIKSNPSLAQKEQVALDLLEGIHHLHKHSVVHRDLKPGNILIVKRGDKTIPVITDFGLSKNAKMEGQSRFSNSFGGGTLKYSSPEQLKAEKLRLNTDLWAYGVIVYEIFTGKNLFMAQQITGASAEAEKEIYEQIIGVDVSEMIKELPSKWQEVVKQCLVRDGAKRIKSTQALKDLILKGETFTESAASTNNDKTLISEVVSEESMNAQTIVNDRQTAQKKAVKKEPIPQKEQPKKQVESKYAKVLQEEKAQKKKMLVGGGITALLIIAIGIIYLINPFGQNDWEIAKQKNTEQSYRTYIENNPEGEHVQNAQEHMAWLQVKDDNSIDSLNVYLNKYPNGLYSSKGKEIKSWLVAKSVNTSEAYKKYLEIYPLGVFNEESTSNYALKLKEEQILISNSEKENTLWIKAQKENTELGYDAYLKSYPKGKYMRKARQLKYKMSLTGQLLSKAGPFYEGLARVENSGKWGFIDKLGNVKIDFQYDKVYDFQKGLSIVKKNNKYGGINKNNFEIIPIKYKQIYMTKDGAIQALISDSSDKKYKYFDSKGTVEEYDLSTPSAIVKTLNRYAYSADLNSYHDSHSKSYYIKQLGQTNYKESSIEFFVKNNDVYVRLYLPKDKGYNCFIGAKEFKLSSTGQAGGDGSQFYRNFYTVSHECDGKKYNLVSVTFSRNYKGELYEKMDLVLYNKYFNREID